MTVIIIAKIVSELYILPDIIITNEDVCYKEKPSDNHLIVVRNPIRIEKMWQNNRDRVLNIKTGISLIIPEGYYAVCREPGYHNLPYCLTDFIENEKEVQLSFQVRTNQDVIIHRGSIVCYISIKSITTGEYVTVDLIVESLPSMPTYIEPKIKSLKSVEQRAIRRIQERPTISSEIEDMD